MTTEELRIIALIGFGISGFVGFIIGIAFDRLWMNK